ncbi:uncharacterized protein LOC108326894 isoform X1 [Vigna angularis]|uniref:uncharacterized protein LOC108326894 isoform X1 n=1 Tax=Phaseolus angularis TaxID=3914 RepID=UPI000809E766|nr:uncharacterized protein LOC108326894 isoform X1 [Vigna angularis]
MVNSYRKSFWWVLEFTLFVSALCNQIHKLDAKCYSVTHSSSQMDAHEAKLLLGFPPNSRPTPSQVKSAYRKKVWESHPDRFPSHEKPLAESKFKLISEAYTCLQSGRRNVSGSVEYSHVVRTGFSRAHGGRKNHAMIKVPFVLIILGTVALGGFNAWRWPTPNLVADSSFFVCLTMKNQWVFIHIITYFLLLCCRAYKKQKEEYPSHNPFLP